VFLATEGDVDPESPPSRAMGPVSMSLALACALAACGPTPESPIGPLASATYVYAFEPRQVTAYSLGADGSVTPLLGERYRSVESGWAFVVGDPFRRFLFGISQDRRAVWPYRVDLESGALSLAQAEARMPSAGYLCTAAQTAAAGRFLYVGADPASTWWGRVHGYSIDGQTAALTEVPNSPFATRIGTHRLWHDPQGRFLYVSNAGKRPGGPECLSGYRIDAVTGALAEIPGSPFKTRAFVNQMEFHPSGKFAYATAGHFLLAYRVDEDGVLEPLPVPDEPVFEPSGTYVFSLVASRDGRFLFAFQQSGWILSYRVDQASGELAFVGEWRGPSAFVEWLLHPEETLAFTLSATPPAIHIHRIDRESGLVALAGAPINLPGGATPHPRQERLFLDASGSILGVVVDRPAGGAAETALLTFHVDVTSGALSPIASVPLGETATPLIAVVRHAATWSPS
jgi:6-phosphogluconolactonase (cycloisomerase 2 family)